MLGTMDTEAELDQLRAERDELRALVETQFNDLADLRRQLAALRERLAEIRNLLHKRYRLSAAVEMELARHLGLTTPVRN